MAKSRPYASQGQVFRDARGRRKLREIADLFGISVARYQNWESGVNRPHMDEWIAIKEKLGIDASKLYAGVAGRDKATEPELDAEVVLGIVKVIERNLAALRVLCAPHVTDKRLEKAGIKDPRQKKPVTN